MNRRDLAEDRRNIPAEMRVQDFKRYCALFRRVGGDMENGERSNGSLRPVERYGVGDVQEVIRQEHDELRELLQQRAETIYGLRPVNQGRSGFGNLFGAGVFNEG